MTESRKPPPRPPSGPPSGSGASSARTDDIDRKPDGVKPKTERPDPTRYGDWEKNGRCIDF